MFGSTHIPPNFRVFIEENETLFIKVWKLVTNRCVLKIQIRQCRVEANKKTRFIVSIPCPIPHSQKHLCVCVWVGVWPCFTNPCVHMGNGGSLIKRQVLLVWPCPLARLPIRNAAPLLSYSFPFFFTHSL